MEEEKFLSLKLPGKNAAMNQDICPKREKSFKLLRNNKNTKDYSLGLHMIIEHKHSKGKKTTWPNN
jgi:hypothetical protein